MEVLHWFLDIFENVDDNKNIIGFVKHSHFYHQL